MKDSTKKLLLFAAATIASYLFARWADAATGKTETAEQIVARQDAEMAGWSWGAMTAEEVVQQQNDVFDFPPEEIFY